MDLETMMGREVKGGEKVGGYFLLRTLVRTVLMKWRRRKMELKEGKEE